MPLSPFLKYDRPQTPERARRDHLASVLIAYVFVCTHEHGVSEAVASSMARHDLPELQDVELRTLAPSIHTTLLSTPSSGEHGV